MGRSFILEPRGSIQLKGCIILIWGHLISCRIQGTLLIDQSPNIPDPWLQLHNSYTEWLSTIKVREYLTSSHWLIISSLKGSILSIFSFLYLSMLSLQSRIMDLLFILQNRKLQVLIATLSTPPISEYQLWPSVDLAEGKMKESNRFLVGVRKEEHGSAKCKSQSLA